MGRGWEGAYGPWVSGPGWEGKGCPPSPPQKMPHVPGMFQDISTPWKGPWGLTPQNNSILPQAQDVGPGNRTHINLKGEGWGSGDFPQIELDA